MANMDFPRFRATFVDRSCWTEHPPEEAAVSSSASTSATVANGATASAKNGEARFVLHGCAERGRFLETVNVIRPMTFWTF